MKAGKTYDFHPKLYEMGRMSDTSEHLLRRFLSDRADDPDRPMAVIQRAVVEHCDRKSIFSTLGKFSACYWRGGRLDKRNLSAVDGEQQSEAGILAMHLGEDDRILPTFKFVAGAERINYDRFMVEPVRLNIIHLPHSSVISWSMNPARAEKLLSNQPGMSDQPIGNNPAGAFGTFVQRRTASNHERLEANRNLIDDVDRYARLLRYLHPDLPLKVHAPATLEREA